MVRDLDSDVRADGPVIVWHGPNDAPAVLVLDPAGEAKRGELPATWRPLAEHLRIGWYRLSAARDEAPTAEEVLADLADVHLVTSGRAVQPVLLLAARHAGRTRSVIVVDPAPPTGDDENWWDQSTASLRRKLVEQRVLVRAFVDRPDDRAVRVERPAPLGHPDVVGRLVETLAAVEPDHGGVNDAWLRIREMVGDPMRRARRGPA